MKPLKLIQMLLSLIVAVTLLTGTAQAALKAVGPTSLVSTLPTWYQDATDLALEPCLDQNGFCILTPLFDVAFTNPPNAITPTGPITPTNFPDEMFYFIADALIPNVGIGVIKKPGDPPIKDNVNFRIAMEAAFLGGVSPGTGIVFLRVNLQKITGLSPNSIYTVTHPYGSFQFSTDSAGASIVTNAGQTYRIEDPVTPTQGVYFPPEMQQAVQTHVGPFLRSSAGLITDPGTGHIYIGNPTVPTTVTGSPYNTNFLQIDGPNIGGSGVNTVSTNNFNLGGRVFTGPIARPLTIDRSTYARDANGGQLDIFVTSLANATITIAGNGIATTVMTPDAADPTKYFSHIPFSGPTLPTSVVITNSLDLVSPIPHPVSLVDEIIISEALYNPVNQQVTIKASSRDTIAPLPSLAATDIATPNTLDPTGTLVKILTSIPPATITVASSRGGSDTIPISVVTLPAPPVAVDDSSTTVAGTAATISVLTNDTTTAALDPTTVAIDSSPAHGTTIVSSSGTVTFIPAAGYLSGTDSFTYHVKDTFGQLSNIATVTVTITAPPAPVAVADVATVVAGSTTVIDVLSNDTSTVSTINPASLAVSAATGGIAAANANGTVSYTAPATAGTYSFSYTVKDNAATPQTSNAATVTVTVKTPAAMSTPANLTTLAGASQTFTWNDVGADLYVVWVGTAQGGNDIIAYPAGGTTAANITLSGLPTHGSTLYVRLWTAFGSTWAYNDYTYTAAGTPVAATMLTPANTSVLGSSQTFTWDNVGANLYVVWVGTTPGGNDIVAYPAGGATGTNITLNGLPGGGIPLYVRLWSLVGSTWLSNDYTFTSAP